MHKSVCFFLLLLLLVVRLLSLSSIFPDDPQTHTYMYIHAHTRERDLVSFPIPSASHRLAALPILRPVRDDLLLGSRTPLSCMPNPSFLSI